LSRLSPETDDIHNGVTRNLPRRRENEKPVAPFLALQDAPFCQNAASASLAGRHAKSRQAAHRFEQFRRAPDAQLDGLPDMR
jgi:hypothetical protein